MRKIISEKELVILIKNLREKNFSISFTNGCFDILHIGHIHVLKEASRLADIVIVGLNSDSSVRRLKGKNRPIQCEKDRIKILEAITYVSYVIMFNTNTPLRIIKLIKPDFLVKGGDYDGKEIVGSEFAKHVVITKKIKGRSTTKIEKKNEKN